MGYPPLEDLLPKTGYSIYKLVRLASARAIELADGAPKMIACSLIEKTPTVALEEIRAGKVVLKTVAENFKPEGWDERQKKIVEKKKGEEKKKEKSENKEPEMSTS